MGDEICRCRSRSRRRSSVGRDVEEVVGWENEEEMNEKERREEYKNRNILVDYCFQFASTGLNAFSFPKNTIIAPQNLTCSWPEFGMNKDKSINQLVFAISVAQTSCVTLSTVLYTISLHWSRVKGRDSNTNTDTDTELNPLQNYSKFTTIKWGLDYEER
jgi:hypothetical protein